MKSNFLSINGSDFLKGLFIAFVTALITGIYQVFQTASSFNWITLKPVLFTAIAAGLSYIIKNYLTNSQGQLMITEKNATPEIVKPLRNVPLSKILILALILSGIGLNSNAQISLFKPVPKSWGALSDTKASSNLKVSVTDFQFIPRINIGVEGASFNLKDLSHPDKLSSIVLGISILHYKNADGVPFNDYGFALMYLKNTTDKGMGIGVYFTYNPGIQNTIWNVGTHYDWILKTEFIDTGLTWHY